MRILHDSMKRTPPIGSWPLSEIFIWVSNLWLKSKNNCTLVIITKLEKNDWSFVANHKYACALEAVDRRDETSGHHVYSAVELSLSRYIVCNRSKLNAVFSLTMVSWFCTWRKYFPAQWLLLFSISPCRQELLLLFISSQSKVTWHQFAAITDHYWTVPLDWIGKSLFALN